MEPTEQSRKVELIRVLVSRGYGGEIRHMLLGESKYSTNAAVPEPIYPAVFENRDSKGFHLMTWVQAHLEFTAKYGCTATEAKEGRKLYFAHHAEYEEWLGCGAPGVLLEELESFTSDATPNGKNAS